MLNVEELELEIAYNKAITELKNSIGSLRSMTVNETDLVLRFIDYTHVSIDAIDRLAAKVASTKEVARKAAAARSALINYRFNR